MRRPRPAASFESFDELHDYWDRRNREADMEAQAADDACAEPEDDDV